jgi:DNA-directed RNA polymerase subunit RPC12/RpoP
MAYKCENCGSTNIKVDFKFAYTSLPEQYGYCCQDCGEKGFVTRREVDVIDEDINDKINDYINDKISNIKGLSGDINIVNTPNTPKTEDKGGGLMGWVCPKCGRCYSPFTSMCPYCNNGLDWNGFKVTC